MKSIVIITITMILVFSGYTRADFSPLTKGEASTEANTGIWFGAWHDSSDPLLPFETMIIATREAVTDGVAMKVVAQAGSIGRIVHEHILSGSVNLTFCVKAKSDLTLRIFQEGQAGSQTFEATTQWKKINLTLDSLPWLLTFELASPASEETWYIIDRLGVETPFEDLDLSGVTTGPEDNLNTSELVIGEENVSGILSQLNNQQLFKIVALGDSVTAGAQMDMGNGYGWDSDQIDRYKYSSVMARHLEQHFGYVDGVLSVTNFGHGGETTLNAINGSYIQNEVLSIAGAADLVILEFGANDLYSGLPVNDWIGDLTTLIDQLQAAGVTQIIVMGITTADVIISNASAISTALETLATNENVAVVDVTRFSTFRGEAYAWAYLANTFHPDASGHMRIGHIASTLFTQAHFNVIPDDNSPPTENCTNGIDDDNDGKIDCADTDCQGGVEICDGLDNNCDGTADEGLTTQPCPLFEGVCQDATSKCEGTAGWSQCDASTYGINYQEVEDRCDGLDNDCDGQTDLNCDCNASDTQVCSTDVGVCQVGTQECDEQGNWGPCDGVMPSKESCNGLDDNCNGEIDESCEEPNIAPHGSGGCYTTQPGAIWPALLLMLLWVILRRTSQSDKFLYKIPPNFGEK